jgi:hypothetical protein
VLVNHGSLDFRQWVFAAEHVASLNQSTAHNPRHGTTSGRGKYTRHRRSPWASSTLFELTAVLAKHTASEQSTATLAWIADSAKAPKKVELRVLIR